MDAYPRAPIRSALISFLVLLLFLGGTTSSVAAQEDTGLPLWEVTRDDGRTVHLMGSFHLLRPEVYPLDDALYNAFDAADVALFELDFEMAAERLMALGTYSDGRTLPDVLPDDLYTELEASAADFGLTASMIESMKPWMAALTLTTLAVQQAGYEAESGIDLHFYERAQAAGTRVVGLETMAEQAEAFESLGDDGQVAYVRSTLDGLGDLVDQVDEGTEYWRRGDAERLAEMITEEWGDHPLVMERLVYDRNQNWVGQVEALFDEPDAAIVIVGVAHLVGERSVVELLRQRGFEVERFSPQRAAAETSR